MISYAAVDSIEDSIVNFEVERIPVTESKPENFKKKKCFFYSISLEDLYLRFEISTEEVNPGDIFELNYDFAFRGNDIFLHDINKNDEEKQRRIEFINKLLKRKGLQ